MQPATPPNESRGFACVYDMSDDRVSGTETFSALPGSNDNPGGFGEEPAEYPKEFRLGTDGGTWIGAPASPEMTLFWCPICGGLHGEWSVEYTGTGAYEGLVYRESAEHSVPRNGVCQGLDRTGERQLGVPHCRDRDGTRLLVDFSCWLRSGQAGVEVLGGTLSIRGCPPARSVWLSFGLLADLVSLGRE